MVRLNRTHYSLFKKKKKKKKKKTQKKKKKKITSKIFKIFKIVFPSQIPVNSTNSAQFVHTVRKFRRIRTFLTYSILCFRYLPRQRTFRNSSELRKFHAVHPHSPRITQNLHHLLTLHLTFQMPGQWQRTP